MTERLAGSSGMVATVGAGRGARMARVTEITEPREVACYPGAVAQQAGTARVDVVAGGAMRIEALEAELRTLRERDARARAREATLIGDVEQRDRALVEALEQQTATAEVPRVIASAPTDLQMVLEAVVRRAMHLSGSRGAMLSTLQDDHLRMVAMAGDLVLAPGFTGVQALTLRTTSPRAVLERRVIHVPDRSDPNVLAGRAPKSRRAVQSTRDHVGRDVHPGNPLARERGSKTLTRLSPLIPQPL